MNILPNRSSKNNRLSISIVTLRSILILLLVAFSWLFLQSSYANEDSTESLSEKDDAVQDIVNPFDSDCYDWRGKNIPCYFKRSYAELLLNRLNSKSLKIL